MEEPETPHDTLKRRIKDRNANKEALIEACVQMMDGELQLQVWEICKKASSRVDLARYIYDWHYCYTLPSYLASFAHGVLDGKHDEAIDEFVSFQKIQDEYRKSITMAALTARDERQHNGRTRNTN